MITNAYVAEQVVRYTHQDRQAAAAAHRLIQEARAARRQARAEHRQARHTAPTTVRPRRRWFAVFTRAVSTVR